MTSYPGGGGGGGAIICIQKNETVRISNCTNLRVNSLSKNKNKKKLDEIRDNPNT